MLESIGKSISTIIDERLSSPLVSSFTIAWLLYNYKFVVILFSATSVSETFRLIHEVSFPSSWIVLRDGIAVPLAAAAAYIYLLPYPSKYVFEKWKTTQKEINAIKQRVEGDALLTIDESRAMRAKERELFAKIDEANNELNKLKDDLRAADQASRQLVLAAQNAEARASDSNTRAEKAEQFARVLATAKEDAIDITQPLAGPANDEESNLDGASPDIQEPSNFVDSLKKSTPTDTFTLSTSQLPQQSSDTASELLEAEVTLLKFIAESFTLTDEEVIEQAPDNRIANRYYLDLLLEKGLLSARQKSEHDERQDIELTHKGRKYLVEHKLVRPKPVSNHAQAGIRLP